MACSITNITVIGDGTTGVPPTTLTVSGLAQDCDTVRVRVICFIGGLATEGDASVDLATGEWSVELTPQPNYACLCGSTISVHAECAADPTCAVDVPVMIQCPGACPVISDLSVVPNLTCNADGTRTVTFNVTITDTSGSNTVAQWIFDSNVPTSKGNLLIIPPLGTQPDSETYNYAAPGIYTATLTIGLPLGCLPMDVPVNIEECPPYCPQPSDVMVTVGDCNTDGTRDVTFTFSTSLTVDINFGDGSSPFHLSGTSITWHYLPVGPYTAEFTVEGCPPLQIPVGPLDECSGTTPPECPEASDISVSVGDCNADGTRDVTFTFSTTLTADINFGDKSSPVSLTGASVTHPYLPVGPYTAEFTVEGCPPLQIPVGPLAECPGGGGGGGGGFNFCALLLILAVIFALIGGLGVAASCIPAIPPIVPTIGLIVELVGVLLFVIWALLCRSTTSCSVMQKVQCFLYVLVIIAFVIAIIILLVGAISKTPLPALLACLGADGIAGISWGAMYAGLNTVMKAVGCARKCP
jgi:hypothetical protein